MASVELLRTRKSSPTEAAILNALERAVPAAGDRLVATRMFQGRSDWLIFFGAGSMANDAARNAQVARGGRVLHWDLGYVERKKVVGHIRMSIDSDHPQQWLDATPPDGARWARFGIKLREDANQEGPILLIGLGRKAKAYLKTPDWERENYERLVKRFPGRRIVFRPKGVDTVNLPCETDMETPIAQLLCGASLVVCRHSNVAVDAAIAGVPFEAENGAAMWLQQREFTPANRLEFLQRLAWWQWRAAEAAQAWAFAKRIVRT